MSKYIATSCEDCKFRHESERGDECNLSKLCLEFGRGFGQPLDYTPPEWCDLRKAVATVALVEGQGREP